MFLPCFCLGQNKTFGEVMEFDTSRVLKLYDQITFWISGLIQYKNISVKM